MRHHCCERNGPIASACKARHGGDFVRRWGVGGYKLINGSADDLGQGNASLVGNLP